MDFILGAVSLAFGFFGGAMGPIHIADLRCIGNESSLLDCHRDNTSNTCTHSEDAGVLCPISKW